jgi:hypothetical protein
MLQHEIEPLFSLAVLVDFLYYINDFFLVEYYLNL